MDVKKIGDDEHGTLMAVLVDGRAFVHGSILDHECARKDAEITLLTAELKKAKQELFPASECAGYEPASVTASEATRSLHSRVPDDYETIRAQVIEECALVAENTGCDEYVEGARAAADEIRKLLKAPRPSGCAAAASPVSEH